MTRGSIVQTLDVTRGSIVQTLDVTRGRIVQTSSTGAMPLKSAQIMGQQKEKKTLPQRSFSVKTFSIDRIIHRVYSNGVLSKRFVGFIELSVSIDGLK